MRKMIFSLFVIVGVFITAVSAQQPATAPTIAYFANDVTTITLADAEAGETEVTLSWLVVGLGEGQRLQLDTYMLNGWESLLEEDEEPLAAVSERALMVQHPLNFNAPTYRLSILDAEDQTLGESIITIPYEEIEELPTIASFTTDVQQIDPAALARGETVTVSWEVANRLPASNLVFEQVLEGGQAVTVELPRPNLWIPSAGQGPVLPVAPQGETFIRLRLRLVDMLGDSVYDEAELMIPLGTSVPTAVVSATTSPQPPPGTTPTATTTAAPPPTATVVTQAQIVSFTAAPDPIDRGGTVTLSWEVRGTSEIAVWRLDPDGRLAESANRPQPTGTWTVTLNSSYVDTAQFQLFVTDAAGVDISAAVTVDINCPFTYFFGTPPDGIGCAAAEGRSVSAVMQPFERGYMIWQSDTRQIYVLYNGGSAGRYQDTWVQGETSDTGTPPTGLIAPERGFGKIWVAQIGVRDNLGWAIGQEQPYNMQIQASGALRYPHTYFTLFDGRTVDLVENSWRFM
jgi:hypothetical protein